MTPLPLTRIAGPLALGTAVVLLVQQLVMASFIDRTQIEATMANPLYVASAVLYFIAFCGLLATLVAVYSVEAREAGVFGAIGFLAALIGTLFLAGDLWFEAFAVPWLGDVAPAALHLAGGVLVIGAFTGYILFAVGWALFGIASLRARVFPTPISIAIIVGGLDRFSGGALAVRHPAGARHRLARRMDDPRECEPFRGGHAGRRLSAPAWPARPRRSGHRPASGSSATRCRGGAAFSWRSRARRRAAGSTRPVAPSSRSMNCRARCMPSWKKLPSGACRRTTSMTATAALVTATMIPIARGRFIGSPADPGRAVGSARSSAECTRRPAAERPGQPNAAPSAAADGTTSGWRTIRNETNRPMSPARSGTSSATWRATGRTSVLMRMISACDIGRLADELFLELGVRHQLGVVRRAPGRPVAARPEPGRRWTRPGR